MFISRRRRSGSVAVNPNLLAIPDSTNYTKSGSSYLAYASPWGKGALVQGTDFTDTITVDTVNFPNNTAIAMSWPATPAASGVYGYMAVSFGNYDGGAPSVAVTPVQVDALTTFSQSWNVTVGSGDYGGLTEFYLTTTSGQDTFKTHEIGFFFHPSAAVISYFNSATLVGSHVNGGVTWNCRQIADGVTGRDVMFMASGNVDVASCTLDIKSALAFLKTNSVITGSEWVNGAALGSEPRSGAGSMTINSLSYTLSGSAVTNLAGTSIAAAPWSPLGNATVINGGLATQAIKETATTADHIVRAGVSKAASVKSYRLQFDAKPDLGRSWVQINSYNSTFGAGARGNFNLSGAGVLGDFYAYGTFVSNAKSILALANGYYRCTMEWTHDDDTVINLDIMPGTADDTSNYLGDVTKGVTIANVRLYEIP
ncbi:hypothetical protein ABEG18_12935 [Alsobacter sp. KACC 23698]|uniref:Uncharacterized protein n=1 Tax=Alsobacter sp. KACC 23698 TaxID=3149229 RepID=A0AAU7JNU7_9HYPH